MMSDDATRNMARRIRGGFTIVELLIVTAMIILLLSILIVAVNRASRTAQITNTRALMNSISQSLERFKEDVGYYPPVLGADRSLVVDAIPDPTIPNPPDDPVYVEAVQDWYSATSLAEYLLGYGHHNQDGYGFVPPLQGGPLYDDESPPLGLRHPGFDGVWGATVNGAADGSLEARMSGTNPNIDTGKVFGPYLQLKDERLIASTDGTFDQNGNLNVYFPGEGNYNDDHPKVMTDYWGRPIRYYRTVYKPGAIKYPFRALGLGGFTPTLADVFVLRPWEVDPGAATDSPIADFGGQGDTTATYALKTAAFAMFSPGPDRSQDATTRFDVNDGDRDDIDGENEDNIVEVGP